MAFLTPHPPCPQGNGRNATWYQWVHNKLTKELRFSSSPTVRIQQKPDGITLHAIAEQSKSSVVAGMTFRGEWLATINYNVGDVVVIRTGASAGSYVCVQAVFGSSPMQPDTGSPYWVSLGLGSAIGQWA